MLSGIETDHGRGAARYYITDLRDEPSVRALQLRAHPCRARYRQRVRVQCRGIRVNGLDPRHQHRGIHKLHQDQPCVLPDMLAVGKGTIIYTGAMGSLRGSPGLSSFSPGKFGLRSLAQIVTREYQERDIHAGRIIVDTPVDGKLIGGVSRRKWAREWQSGKLDDVDAHLSAPADLVQIYWFLHTQPRSAWTQELDVRAQKVNMFSKL
ncbi:hypothetical protein LTR96_011106 [Exophiala xenobiotica]|nr:hypothetical protein LTR41_011279 [Exophiala xenobiotica]KAK5215767.1 hypothetical protein LTR72_011181 [Exophiala xenobiotica]KAK5220880.1 hypothetical protein LTR47_011036 [Exophiala xenobiotica]KAK5245523.1 hypothetical protein LTS06_009045 [Exophiala xenobiotica]KAK5263472.1 hypothetical protein LTR96_011106 [Exophiala xenobiotica]